MKDNRMSEKEENQCDEKYEYNQKKLDEALKVKSK